MLESNDQRAPTPQQKGDALEAVISAIETLILQASPAAKDKTHVIESKKIIEVGGVRHEIDLYVTSEIAPGYKAIFIFECKNWKEAVGKNEIIVFSEKIDACSAQHGFFVAKSFTSDAQSQASKDPRIVLRLAKEHDPASTIVPFGFHYTVNEPTKVSVTFKKKGSSTKALQPLDMSQARILLDGAVVDPGRYVDAWVGEAINESTRTFPSGTLPDSTYTRSCQSSRKLAEGSLSINGIDIESAVLEVEFLVHLKRPAVVSHFEVGGRGRVITLEGYTHGSFKLDQVQFTFGPEAT